MHWVNYHSHCNFCDGSDHPEEYILKALGKGFPAYGFSSHAPLPFPTEWCIPEERFDDYLTEINGLKNIYNGRIQVYLGLEVDYIPDIAGVKKILSKRKNIDYFIGSVHFVDSFSGGGPWSFDGSTETFKKGFKNIYHGNGQRMICRYYELVRQMIEEEKPDIVGHLDKIKMHNHIINYLNEKDNWYKNEVIETIKTIKRNDVIVEVNTRGYYKNNRRELLYPGEWILEKLYQHNVKVMINADAHHPDELDKGFFYAAKTLRKIGFKYVWTLYNGEWNANRFTERGITGMD